MSSQRWKHRFPTDGDLAINECQKVSDLRKQLIRCETGTDSKVWMREERAVFHERAQCPGKKFPGLFM